LFSIGQQYLVLKPKMEGDEDKSSSSPSLP